MEERKIILHGKPDLDQLEREESDLLITSLAFLVLEVHREQLPPERETDS